MHRVGHVGARQDSSSGEARRSGCAEELVSLIEFNAGAYQCFVKKGMLAAA